MYNHFKILLIKKINDNGKEKLAEKVEKLKNLIAKAEKRCEVREIPMTKANDRRFDPRLQKKTKDLMPSKKMMKDTECLLLTMTGSTFTAEMRKVHRKRLENEKC